MGILKTSKYSDAASDLFSFYEGSARQLEEVGQYFMAAVALSFGIEGMILAYLLAEFDDDEIEVTDRVGFTHLIEFCSELGVLSAPIDIPSHAREDGRPPKYVAMWIKLGNFEI
jgi:hypothetical protein